MKVSIACLAVNIIFALGLVWPFRQGGLGIANTVSSAFNVALLLYALRRKLGKLELEPLRAVLWPLVAAGALAAVIAWWGGRLWDRSLGHATLPLKIGAVFVPGGMAGLVYWLMAMAAKVPAAKEITGLLFRRFRAESSR